MNSENLEIVQPLLFPVTKVSSAYLEVDANPLDANPNMAYLILAHPSGIDKPAKLLHTCSERFSLIPCSELFPELFEMLDEVHLETGRLTYKMIADTKFYLFIPITNKKQLFPKLLIEPELWYQHAYDHTLSFDQNFGFRLNGIHTNLSFPMSKEERNHLNFKGKTTFNCEITRGCKTSIRYFDSTIKRFSERIHKLSSKIVDNPNDRLFEILASCKVRSIEKVHTYVYNSLPTNQEVSELDIYLAIHNEHIYNDSRNIKHPEVRQQLDSTIINFIYNTSTFDLDSEEEAVG